MVSLKDVYGDHGIVSLVCLKVVRKKFIFIDTLLMSCRVLGRYLEEWKSSYYSDKRITVNQLKEFIDNMWLDRNEEKQ